MRLVPQFLTQQYPPQKHLFLLHRFLLSLIGFYPETKQTAWLRLWALINWIILAYGSYAEFYYGLNFIAVDVSVALDALCPVATSIMAVFKLTCFWWYRLEFKQLIEQIRRLTTEQDSPEKLKWQRRYFTIVTQLTAVTFFFGFCTANTYSFRALLTVAIRLWKGEEMLYVTPYNMILPPVLMRMPIYPITFVVNHWHGYITVIGFSAGDGFFLAVCLYLATLFKALQVDVRTTLAEASGDLDSAGEAEVCRKLGNIIQRHNEISDMAERFTSLVKYVTLGHFVTAATIIGMSVINLMLFRTGIILYVVYTCAAGAELFLYCLGGTAVGEASEELGTAAYCSNWSSHSVKVQKMVLLLIMRSQRRLTIKVPFFAPSLPTLANILRFTGSLIALAQSIL